MIMKMSIAVLWIVTPCSFVDNPKMGAIHLSITLITTYKTI